MIIDEKIATVMEFISYVRTKLGEPKIDVELANSQIATNLNDAVQLFREYANDSGHFRQYMTLQLIVGQQDYLLPDDVMQIGYTKRGTETTSAWVLAQLSGYAASDVLSLKSFDMVSYTLLLHWIHYLRLVTRSPYRFLFNSNSKILRVIPNPERNDKVFIETFRQESLDNLIDHRWIKDYTLALCKIELGMIRSKFGSLPGFNNAVSLDGDSLKQEGIVEKEKLEDDLILTYKFSSPPFPVFRSTD